MIPVWYERPPWRWFRYGYEKGVKWDVPELEFYPVSFATHTRLVDPPTEEDCVCTEEEAH